MHDEDELISFRNVSVVRATSTALFCAIEGMAVWLPRGQAHGRLKQKGDRGTLQIRRSVAVARDLPTPESEIGDATGTAMRAATR